MKKKVKDLQVGDALWYSSFFSGRAESNYHTVKQIVDLGDGTMLFNNTFTGNKEEEVVHYCDNVYHIDCVAIIPKVVANLKTEISILESGIDTYIKEINDRKQYLFDLEAQLSWKR